jgi:peptide/nickel transport system permease protein
MSVAPPGAAPMIGQSQRRYRSPLMQSLRRLSRNVGAMVGLTVLILMILVAVFADYVAPYSPIKLDPNNMLLEPSREHLFGTDQFGRDIFTRMIFGARISLRVGIISVLIAAVVGGTLGMLAGYWGGRIETLIMRLMDAMLAFPGLLLALSIVATLGPSMTNVMIAVGISWVPSYARLVRGTVLSAKQNLYVEAARAVGASARRIMFVHLLPNVVAPVIILSSLGVAGSIITAASLSYLGLGAQPPTPEWGLILSQGRSFLQSAWWISTFPGLVIMFTVFAINLLGDGLRDALDPRLKIG